MMVPQRRREDGKDSVPGAFSGHIISSLAKSLLTRSVVWWRLNVYSIGKNAGFTQFTAGAV